MLSLARSDSTARQAGLTSDTAAADHPTAIDSTGKHLEYFARGSCRACTSLPGSGRLLRPFAGEVDARLASEISLETMH